MEVLSWITDNSFMILYAIAVGVAIWRYPRYFDTPLKFFPILLMYTFLNELLGSFIHDFEDISLTLGDIFYNNWVIYNFYNLVFYLYFYYIFWSYLKGGLERKFVAYGAVLYLLAGFINLFFQDFTFEPQVFSYVVGGLILKGCIFLYARQLKATTGTYFGSHNLLSWLSLGMLVFYLGYIPIKLIKQYNAYYELEEDPIVRVLHVLLIVIMYSCFIIGFVRMSRKSLN